MRGLKAIPEKAPKNPVLSITIPLPKSFRQHKQAIAGLSCLINEIE
jgi:hypothetical protein